MVWAAFLLAYWVRTQNILAAPPVSYMMPWQQYMGLTFWIALGWVVIFASTGLYNPKSHEGLIKIWQRVFIAVSVSLALFIIVLFGIKESFFSRLIAAYVWVIAIVLVFLGRWLSKYSQWWLAKSGLAKEFIVVIGNTPEIEEVKKFYAKRMAIIEVLSAEALHEAADVEALINKSQTDQVIVAGELLTSNGLGIDLINFCEINGIRFRYLPNITELHALHVVSDVLEGYPIIELRPTPLDGWGRIVKRVFDFVFSALGIIILSPVMIIIAMIIRRDSPGPALFIQRRPGQFGKEFNFYKFRSMYNHLSTGSNYGGAQAEAVLSELRANQNEASGPMFKMKNDPRVTKIGRFIRRTSLDELPQLFNVLNGEMSLVGPRPPLTNEVAEYNRQQLRRLMVKPGLTGIWQVSGRSDSSFEEYLRLDMYYIEHWSLWLDIQIILKTIWAVFTRKGAY
ncbi:MAG: sugar transferase [Patescibacteria group bacterium]|jgi:exopolysaccharide biosynthesis polyprenyl glycosylphosphotransferase